jgi:S1-C subfamily serine protease
VLLGIEDKPVSDPQNMLTLVAGLQPGSTAKLKLRRAQEELEVKVLVGKRPKPPAEKQ